MVLSKSGAHIQKPAVHTDRWTNQKDVTGDAPRAATRWPRKRDHAMELCIELRRRLRTAPLMPPLAYKYPGISRGQEGEFLV